MKLKNYIIICVCNLYFTDIHAYQYISYSPYGETQYYSYDLAQNKMIVGDAVIITTFKKCSNKDYKCLQIDGEYIFVPKNIPVSGDYSSPFGTYHVYANKGGLPFSYPIDYKILNLYPVTGNTMVIFYNKIRGVIAFNYSGDKEFSSMIWLISKCGLLSDKHCLNKTKPKPKPKPNQGQENPRTGIK